MRASTTMSEPRTPVEAQVQLYGLASAQESRTVSTWEALVRVVRENPDIHQLAMKGFWN
jgi:hypothetical protein